LLKVLIDLNLSLRRKACRV